MIPTSTAINAKAQFFDMHPSMVAQQARYGFLGPIKIAIIEACEVNDSEVVLFTGVGCTPTWPACRSGHHRTQHLPPHRLRGFHDLYQPDDHHTDRQSPSHSQRSHRYDLQITERSQAWSNTVWTTKPPVPPCDETTLKVGYHVAEFLAAEMAADRMPKTFALSVRCW